MASRAGSSSLYRRTNAPARRPSPTRKHGCLAIFLFRQPGGHRVIPLQARSFASLPFGKFAIIVCTRKIKTDTTASIVDSIQNRQEVAAPFYGAYKPDMKGSKHRIWSKYHIKWSRRRYECERLCGKSHKPQLRRRKTISKLAAPNAITPHSQSSRHPAPTQLPLQAAWSATRESAHLPHGSHAPQPARPPFRPLGRSPCSSA